MRQRPIDQFIVDFYCAKAKFVIEIDGDSHFNEDAKDYDTYRSEVLNSYEIRVIRFTNDEIFHSFEQVVEIIQNEIKANSSNLATIANSPDPLDEAASQPLA